MSFNTAASDMTAEIPVEVITNPTLLFLYYRVEHILGIKAGSGALIKLGEYYFLSGIVTEAEKYYVEPFFIQSTRVATSSAQELTEMIQELDALLTGEVTEAASLNIDNH
jgi:hypothetical protein